MGSLLRFAFRLVALLTLIAWATPGDAARPLQMLSQYSHRAWRVEEGTLPMPTAIAQTSDGYLYIGTKSGLFRFDGIRFVQADVFGQDSLSGARIWSMLAVGDDLWIGATGFVARIRGGRLTRYVVTGRAVQMVAEADALWFVQTGSRDAVCSIIRDTLTCYARPEIPLDHAHSISKAPEGFWIGSDDALCHWTPGRAADCFLQERLAPYRNLMGVSAVEARPDRSVWVGIGHAGTNLGLGRIVDNKWVPFEIPALHGSSLPVMIMAEDQERSLWVGTDGLGLYRIHDDIAERFGTEDGLTSNTVDGNFLEDREGTLWVTTSGGLDAFHRLPVSVYSQKQGLAADSVQGVLAAADGSIWLTGQHASTIVDDHVAPVSAVARTDQTEALLQDRDGRIWMGVGNDLNFMEQGRLQKVLDRERAPVGAVQSMAEDSNGDIYATTVGASGRLLRIVNRVVVDESPRSLGDDVVSRVAGSPRFGVWVGYQNGGWARVENGHTAPHRTDAKPGGTVVDLYADGKDAVLVATAAGLTVARGAQIRQLDTAHGLPCQQVNSVLRDSAATVFLSADCGIIVIDAAELDRWFAAPESRIRSRLLDGTDGVRPGSPYYTPHAARGSDGRLWFASGTVAEVFDPAALVTRPAPPVRIEEMTADRAPQTITAPLTLLAGTRDISIRYTALSFIAPQKIVFQYRLDGRDAAWHDAGTRREAFYTDLPPGSYRFHVRSADSDGRWDAQDAALDFGVQPFYYQTRWFALLCSGLAALMLYGFYVVRLRQAAASERRKAAIQNQERIRIARELHDTLLQSTQGLILRFQRATSRIPGNEPAREMMEHALDRADAVIAESRQRVKLLRAADEATMDLVAALSSIVADLDELDGSSRLSMTTRGDARTIDGRVGDEILMVVREALTNAVRHSRASRIEALVAFEPTALRVMVVDDGIGMPHAMTVTGREGHWGIASMRERADGIGARLQLKSSVGTGTSLTLALPAAAVYAVDRWRRPAWWRRVFSSRVRSGAGRRT